MMANLTNIFFCCTFYKLFGGQKYILLKQTLAHFGVLVLFTATVGR